jgi:hypothetical protein
MQLTWIKMTKNHSWGRAGSEIEVSEDVAKRLVGNNYAKRIDAPESKKPETKKVAPRKLSNKSLSAAE